MDLFKKRYVCVYMYNGTRCSRTRSYWFWKTFKHCFHDLNECVPKPNSIISVSKV